MMKNWVQRPVKDRPTIFWGSIIFCMFFFMLEIIVKSNFWEIIFGIPAVIFGGIAAYIAIYTKDP